MASLFCVCKILTVAVHSDWTTALTTKVILQDVVFAVRQFPFLTQGGLNK